MKHHWSLESRALSILLFATLLKSIITSTDSSCSCYTFKTNMLTWYLSNENCKNNGGSLVSIETEQEYQFINKTIQSLDVGNDNEWYISLKRTPGGWKWNSGSGLTIEKWQPDRPRENDQWNRDCVVMAKNYPDGYLGLFSDYRCGIAVMFICEYKNGQSCGQQSITRTWCHPTEITKVPVQYFTTAATTVTTTTTDKSSTTASTTTSSPTSKLIPSDQIPSSRPASTAIHNKPTTITDQMDTTTILFQKKNDERSTRSTSQERPTESFEMVIVVIALGVLLAVSVCLLAFACYWKRRKRADKQETKNRDTTESEHPFTCNQWAAANRNSTEGVQLFHQNNSKSYVTYAVINNNLTQQNDQNQAPSTSNEPQYASIEDGKMIKRPCSIKNDPSIDIPAVATNVDDDSMDSVGGIKSNMAVVYASVNKEKCRAQGIGSDEAVTKSIKNSNQDGKQCSAGQQVLYASVDESKESKAKREEVLYAEVGSDANAEKQQPYQITYAELGNFNQNLPNEAIKPAPYQKTEYAVIKKKAEILSVISL